MAVWNSKKELCTKWYPVLFPVQDNYTRWKFVDGSVMSHVVAEMYTLRNFSFCEVTTLPMHDLHALSVAALCISWFMSFFLQ